MINVSYAINERYVDYCLVSMFSLMENNIGCEVNFHILTDSICNNSKLKLQGWVSKYNCRIHFYEIPDIWIDGLALNCWSKYAWYRLFLPQLLPTAISKILYLDTDTIITGSITELFELNLSSYSIAGCKDIMSFYDGIFKRLGYPHQNGYVCSGVLLFNLEFFRKNYLSNKIFDFARTYPDKINFPDQDAINYVCHSSTLHLPLKYDILAPFLSNKDFFHKHQDEVIDMLEDPRIIHYAGCNPWKKEIQRHYYHDVFWKYANTIGGIRPVSIYSPKDKAIIAVKRILARFGVKEYKKYLDKNRVVDFSHLKNLTL